MNGLERRVMLMRKKAPENIDIPGYEGKYFVSQNGTIWRRFKTKNVQIKGTRNGRGRDIKLTDNSGKTICTTFSAIMKATYFKDLVPAGYVLMHINGIENDWSIFNLQPIKRDELGRLRNRSNNAKTVEKVDIGSGETVAIYKSAREAGRRNFMSYQTILDSCNCVNKKRRGIAPDGFLYRWLK